MKAKQITNRYDYLKENHDLSLPEWGPYCRKYFGLSHIADQKNGLCFDFSVMPGIHRRELAIPDGIRPSAYLPWQVSEDLGNYSYRQQIIPKDKVYADISFAEWGTGRRIVECSCKNHSGNDILFGIHFISRMREPAIKAFYPILPKDVIWLDAIEQKSLKRCIKKPQDGLVYDAMRRGENRHSEAVGGSAIILERGDILSFSANGFSSETVIIRVKNFEKDALGISLNGIYATVKPSENWQLIEVQGTEILSDEIEVSLISDGKLYVDGLLMGNRASETIFNPVIQDLGLKVISGPVKNSCIFECRSANKYYGLWWSHDSDFCRCYHNEMDDFLIYNDIIHKPFFGKEFGNQQGNDWIDTVIIPENASNGESRCVYAVLCSGMIDEVRDSLTEASQADIFRIMGGKGKKYWIPASTDAGRDYLFSRERMAAVTHSNLLFPIRIKGQNVKHHTPGRYWNCLYTWDSGFIGIGLLEISRRRAIENLNAYLTEPDDEECAFVHHGTPVPVQIYLFNEIINRECDEDMLRYFYPRLRHYYNFMSGRAESSTMRGKSRRTLIKSYDYFYSTGGWDDYPPQWFVNHSDLLNKVAPVVGSSHVIRCAKILSSIASTLGLSEDIEMYQVDIDDLSKLLRKDSWDADAGYFSYVRYDDNEKAIGIVQTQEGENFNKGLDGISPLFAGICNSEEKNILWEKLESPAHCWTDFGISTVDQSAEYFRLDGYWNGCVWFPYQWFFWKAALDDARTDFAWKIAETALKKFETETKESYNCYENFGVSSGRGGGWHHFSGLSTPILAWFGAYFAPGRLTGGFDTQIRKFNRSEHKWSAELNIAGEKGKFSTLIAVVGGEYSWNAEYDGKKVPVRVRKPGTLELELPQRSSGVLLLETTNDKESLA